MAGENDDQYFLTDLATGKCSCTFCEKKYAKSKSSTRLRGQVIEEARRLFVPQLVRDSLAIKSSKTQILRNAEVSMSMDDKTVMSHLRNDNDISWVCQFCGHPFPWDVQPKTFGHHLTTICESAPEAVREAGQRIEEQEFSESVEDNDSNFKTQTEDSTNAGREVEAAKCSRSLIWERMKLLNTSKNNDSNFKTQTEDSTNAGREVEAAKCSRSLIWERMKLLNTSKNNDSNFEAETESSNKRQRTTPDALPIVAALEVPMVAADKDTGESASLTKRLVGDAWGRNVEKLWSWLMDDQVLRVGIYGMGGVGKTTLMRHIQTRLEGERSFEVYWITVSQDFSIFKLQNLIAKKIGLSFPDEEDEVDRAGKLTQLLKVKGKCVLILDDLWNYFDAAEVGIPVGVNLCKLVLITRLLPVCRQMDCSKGNTIQLQALSKDEAWFLFTQELGNYSTEVEELAQAICRECAGLPLGIKVMARSMKGIYDVHIWRSALNELKESRVSKGHETREDVFYVLKFSYLRLNDPALQECLSYCALFPEDAKTNRTYLIEHMIDEGIIDAKDYRRAKFDKGHTMLDTLENACLLEGDTSEVWMHDLIRDMVILELRQESKTLVEAGEQLKELPNVEKWTENLVRVSLIGNDIEVIPPSHTPRCPNLSTLLLSENGKLKMIANPFFLQFQKLKVLDLSWCEKIVELPKSISDLVNLTALLLGGCISLIHVPPLAKLLKLEKLDLHHCWHLKVMPKGVRFLLNLKYLDISWSGIKVIKSGIVPMLSRLQVLKLCNPFGVSKFSITGSEVGELRMLETLYCRFSNVAEFGEYMKSRERSQQSLSEYFIFIQRNVSSFEVGLELELLKSVSVMGVNFIDPLTLPIDIEALHINNCRSSLYKRLFPPSLLASLLNLQEIHVCNWGAIEEIFATIEGENGEGSSAFTFSNYSTHSISNNSLLNLKRIDIWYCPKLKKLFPHSLLPNLHNIQTISVVFCNGMEEIFSTDQEIEGQELSFVHLSRLTILELRDLPELRSIYNGPIICHSLQEIQLVDCPKLKRITLSLPQPSLQTIQVYPKHWWDSVQWGSAKVKNYLEPFVKIRNRNAEGSMSMDDRAVMRHLWDDNNLGSWVCQFCGEPFPYDVLPEAIRHHLIWKCERAPEDVKEAAQRIEEDEFSISVEGNNSNFNPNAEQTRILYASENTEDSNYAERLEEAAECSWGPTRIPSVSVQGSLDVKAEVSTVECSNKRQREGNIVQRSNKRQSSMPDALPIPPEVEVPEAVKETGESATPAKFLVGDAFRRNVDKIWCWLMDDQVLRAGIYGMGGVGKTALMRYIQTRLKAQSSFQVYRITASQDFSIWKLQDLIAKRINLLFNDNEDEVERAEKLTESLKAKGKCVLMLDDLWNEFDADEVGIPVGVNLCRLVLTTRLLEVCRKMDCNEENTIQVQPLSKREAWILFTQELGNYETEVEELAKAVCRECVGLPLGIKVVARSMNEICNVRTWRNILEELKEAKFSKGHEMEEVFSVLKFSYLRLKNSALQKCLSYCALFPEDAKIDRNDLIELMIAEGIIDERKSRQVDLDKGNTMLDMLENSCFLEGDTETVWMHDLIRDMILELRGESKTVVEAGAQLKDVEKWTGQSSVILYNKLNWLDARD